MQGFVFEEYWLASQAWERHGLTTGAARSLVHNGSSLSMICRAHDLGRKSLAALDGLMRVVNCRAMTEGDRAARRAGI
jgi:hypothetical protein